jgi:hypothetical protein
MDCLEFRRQLLADPRCGLAEFLAHARACTGCAQAQQRALAFEATLNSALAIAAPPQLAESILLRQATEQQRSRQRWRRGGALLALAAGVVLAFGIGMRLQAKPLAELAVRHLEGEAFVLSRTQSLPAAEVRNAFARLDVKVGELPANVSWIGCCPVGRYSAVHLVMQQGSGPVTVLYLADDSHEARADFAREGWLGRSVPLAHGTLVLLAHDASRFDEIEQQWRSALQNATFSAATG